MQFQYQATSCLQPFPLSDPAPFLVQVTPSTTEGTPSAAMAASGVTRTAAGTAAMAISTGLPATWRFMFHGLSRLTAKKDLTL